MIYVRSRQFLIAVLDLPEAARIARLTLCVPRMVLDKK